MIDAADAGAVSAAVERRARQAASPATAEIVLTAVGLLLLVMALYYPIVFQGRSLVHSNYSNPFDWRPLPQNYGDNFIPHTEWVLRGLWPFPNIRDPGAVWWQWEPSTEFFKQAIADREWPFWDPYVAAGTPAMANMVPAYFFPPYLLVVLLGGTVTLKNAYFLFLLWAASCLTFRFLRDNDLSWTASVGGSVVVLMSGTMNQNLGSFAGQTIACLPLVLYATRRFLDWPDVTRFAALVLWCSCAMLASFPPLLIGIFAIAIVYAVVALARGDCDGGRLARMRVGVRLMAAGLLAAGLVAFQYFPAFALRAAMPHVAGLYRDAGLETMPIVRGYQLLAPAIMGGVQLYWNDPLAISGAAHIPYIGMAAMVAALMARPGTGRQRTLFAASVLAAAGILLKLFGVPPMQWLGYLPVFNEIHFSHYLGVPLAFPLAFLAAIGLDRIARGMKSATAAALIAVIVIAAMEGLWRIADGRGIFQGPTAEFWTRDWKFLAIIAALTTVAIVVHSLARFRAVDVAVVGVIVVLVAAEGFYNTAYPRPRRWNAYRQPVPYVRVLQEDAAHGRVFPFGIPAANGNEAFAISSLDSLMAFNPPRLFDLYMRYTEAPRQVFLREAKVLPPDPVLDRANVSFVGMYRAHASAIQDVERRGYARRFDDGFITLFSRTTAPRFLFSSEYRVTTPAQSLDAIEHGTPREVVLEEAPRAPAAPNDSSDPEVRVESYKRNGITLAVNAPRAGLVYAAESFFDGWSARVNGAPVRILPANYAFRAVEVPAGAVRIEFRYWPPGLTAGLIVSSLSLLVLAGVFLTGTAGARSLAARGAA